jgi:hypothetical protein
MNTTDVQTLIHGAADERSKRIVARLALTDACIGNTFALVAAVYRRAMKDARMGDVDAIEFLGETAPDWQELSTQYRQTAQERQGYILSANVTYSIN